MPTIAILGTLDSKGEEHAFLADRVHERGHTPLLIDVGTGSEPPFKPDYSRFDVAAAAGLDLAPLLQRHDRGECVIAMSQAAPLFIAQLAEAGTIDGVISLGGGGGTAIATAAMRALPIGFPKLMVSTLASGNTAHYMGCKDIVMMPSIVDVCGLNRLSRNLFTRAAGAICGMVEAKVDADAGKPLIVASMFGNTTTCINEAKAVLENAGYEVLVFHATGSGGRAMESLIESGLVTGVLDLTTTEWADEIVGATLSAGPSRMDAMSKARIPAVIAPGCVDMANFGARETVPDTFAERTFYQHNPQVTLMRTNAQECAAIGETIARKANANPAPVAILNPLQAVSEINGQGQPFYDPEADQALFEAIHAHAKVEVIDLDETINSQRFARACAEKLLELIERHR
ncbi:Tm-1-like ATP-binding domain-containing protein [Pelagicoccus sp. SDUM812005]|uniref:Tm-1-like ATP-binding domain-containing protein n=1 Tax=Pelagicoccus sp. SDUM812005 TaxID=3041257 RepID=UPI00280F6219|nr:Tm-1-like ATP-binding domain-containing protein [Pelagicoccus sp. SDUM812005]MDQ8183568.1 Tm-1-like ATP-binding domain-containing protein [Pelagicoccus sp. SDUM812005]